MKTGCVSAKRGANLSEEESIRSLHSDCLHIQMTVSYTLQPTKIQLRATHMVLIVMGMEVSYKYVCLQWWHHMVRRRYSR